MWGEYHIAPFRNAYVYTYAGRQVVWSHPAFADRRIYARNDHEIICLDLVKK
jgi:hypothetical protein